MRLIDADELKKALVKHFDACFNENGKLMYSDHIRTSDDIIDLFNLIDKQPTAFDVDKAVCQMKRDKITDCETILSDIYQGYNAGLSRAIDIVKRGGDIELSEHSKSQGDRTGK